MGASKLAARLAALTAGLPELAAMLTVLPNVRDGKNSARATPMSALEDCRPCSALSISGLAVIKSEGGVRFTCGIFNEARSACGIEKFCGAKPSKMARAFAA